MRVIADGRTSLAPGEYLFLQGEPSPDFSILLSGKVEILVVDGAASPDRAAVERDGRRIATVDEPKSPIGEMGAFLAEPRSASVRALEPSTFMRLPATGDALFHWLAANSTPGLGIARVLCRRYARATETWRTLVAADERVRRLTRTLSLGLTPFTGGRIEEAAALFGEGEERDVPPPHAPIDEDLVTFFARALASPNEDLTWMTGGDAAPLLFVIGRLVRSFPELNARIHEAVIRLEISACFLSGERESIAARYARAAASVSPDLREDLLVLIRRLLGSCGEIAETFLDLQGRVLPSFREGLAPLEAFLSAPAPSPAAAAAPAPGPARVAAPAVAAAAGPLRVLDEVLSVPGLPTATAEEFRAALAAHAAGGGEPAAKALTQAYWRVYAPVFFASLRGERPAWTLFLRYGVALSGATAPDLLAPLLAPPGNGSCFPADAWLRRILRGEVPPSNDELSRSYEEVLKDSRRDRFAEGETDASADMVRYEIERVLAPAARAASGGRTAVPVVATPEALSSLLKNVLRSADVAAAVARVLETDFSAFYREVRIVLGTASEYVHRDVAPRFILLPGAGGRALPWQEYEGRAKGTPGRIFLPSERRGGDLDETILDAVGRYRWELHRAIAGPSAADPVEGGLTGAYSDYAQFFKKNPEIPPAERERLQTVWQSLRMPRDRFVADYRDWIRYEAKSIQKLNRVARRIFAEHVPFPTPLRARLARHPAFEEALRKDSNKRAKKLQEIKFKLVKWKKNGVDTGDAYDLSMRLYEPVAPPQA